MFFTDLTPLPGLAWLVIRKDVEVGSCNREMYARKESQRRRSEGPTRDGAEVTGSLQQELCCRAGSETRRLDL